MWFVLETKAIIVLGIILNLGIHFTIRKVKLSRKTQ